jgi:hypothetical protein
MLLRSMKCFFNSHRSHWLVAAFAGHLAITASGIPCLCLCLGEVGETTVHERANACQDETGADSGAHHAPCSDNSPCVRDQAPALAVHDDEAAPFFDHTAVVLEVDRGFAALTRDGASLHGNLVPDRGPPIPRRFAVLRI